MKYLIPLILFTLSAVAYADIPPSQGYKRVGYGVEIKNKGEFKDYVFFVYPWSTSDGRPMAEVGDFSLSKTLRFGRRIMGTPSLYAIKRDQYAAYVRAQHKEREGKMVTGFPYIDCGVKVYTRHTVPDDHIGDIIDTYVIKSVSGAQCSVEKYDPKSPKAKSKRKPK